MNSLDNILSGRTDAPAQAVTQEEPKPTTQEVATEQEATTEQPTETEGAQTGEAGKPPIGAIRQAEREKADKRYTAVLDGLRKEIVDRDAAWERRLAAMTEAMRPKPEPKPAPDFFENPTAATLHTVGPQFDEFRSVMQANSRIIAETKHGDDAVEQADQAFSRAFQSRTLDPADYQRVINSPNIYDAAVKWHKRQQAQAEIGDDPAAYREKLKAQIKAELEAEAGGAGQQQNGQAPVMPSNFTTVRSVGSRAGPAWTGPKSLNEIFSIKR